MNEIRRQIIGHVDLDTKIRLGIRPKKIDPKMVWNLENELNLHDGLIYIEQSRTLFDFSRYPECIRISRPLEMHILHNQPDSDAYITIFNIENKEFSIECISNGECSIVHDLKKSWMTMLKVLIK